MVLLSIPLSSAASFILVQFGGDLIQPQIIFLIGSAMTAFNFILLYFINDKPLKSKY